MFHAAERHLWFLLLTLHHSTLSQGGDQCPTAPAHGGHDAQQGDSGAASNVYLAPAVQSADPRHGYDLPSELAPSYEEPAVDGVGQEYATFGSVEGREYAVFGSKRPPGKGGPGFVKDLDPLEYAEI